MDLLYATCTNQPDAAGLSVAAYLRCDRSYAERLEFVRCWAAVEGCGDLPLASSKFRCSPKVGPDGALAQWLAWALVDDGWACAAAHANAAAMVAARFAVEVVAPYPHRSKLAAFLRSYAAVATLSTSGSAYLNAVVRCACPGYRTAISSSSLFYHASALIPERINTVMSPCVHRTIARQYEDMRWLTCTPQQFALVAALLADATGDGKLLLNGDLCLHAASDPPVLFIAHDFDAGCGDTVAVVMNEKMYCANGAAIDVVGAFIKATPESGIHAVLAGEASPPARLAAHFV